MTNAVNIASLGSAMTATSAGNVGIGTSSPTNLLTVNNTAGGTGIKVTGSGTGTQYISMDSTGGNLTIGLDNSVGGLTGTAYTSFVGTYANTPLALITNSGVRLTLGTNGNLSFNTSNAGIVFNNSSALTNSTLNDYEVGTWTPTANNTSASLTFSGAVYTKIGRVVYIACTYVNSGSSVTFTANSSYIGGLPFSPYGSNSPCAFSNNYIENFGIGVIYSGPVIYTPSFTLINSRAGYLSGVYMTTF